MRSSLIAFAVFAIAGTTQDNGKSRPEAASPGTTQPPGDATLVGRLEAVTWNPTTAQLSWVVSIWDPARSVEQPAAKKNYTIQIDKALMEFDGEGRRFDKEEARQVRILMDMISTYAVESTVWWDNGEGEKVDDKVAPAPDRKEPDKGNKTKPDSKPARVVLRGPVAAAQPLPQPLAVTAGSH
jgi:hypothetical protein